MMKQYISRQDFNSLHYVKNNVNITFLFDLISARALLWPKPGVACDHKSLGLGDVCIYNSLAKITLGVFIIMKQCGSCCNIILYHFWLEDN